MRSYKKTTRHVCIFYFSSVKYQFYIHFQNKSQLGGWSTRPPIGSSPLDPTWYIRPRIPSHLRHSVPPQSYRAVDATDVNVSSLICEVRRRWTVSTGHHNAQDALVPSKQKCLQRAPENRRPTTIYQQGSRGQKSKFYRATRYVDFHSTP